MRGYVKRISQKASKLSPEQLISILNNVVDENESLYSILDSISTGILIVDNDFIITQTNAILESLLPTISHYEDSRNSLLPVWTLTDNEEISSFFKSCWQKKITNTTEEFTITNSTRTTRFISITMMPLMHEGQLFGRIFLVQDITESRNQDILVHRMENLSSLTNLAAGMAHEIKNPLGAISIHIQLIQKALQKARDNNDILPPKKFVEEHIDVVNEEIEHLNSLVMDFLFAVRPVKANLELKDPSEVIKKIVNFFEPEFNNSNIDIQYIANNTSQKIMIDEKLFKEVLVNLAHNALAAIQSKYEQCNGEYKTCQNEERIGKFVIESAVAENKYVIRITDNGCGMSPETISKVFEPYYTTKANGTGLGMTMVYKIIKEFSGDISIHSKENEGTSFTIVLPMPQNNKKLIGQTKFEG